LFSCMHHALMTSSKLQKHYVQLKRPDANEDKLCDVIVMKCQCRGQKS